MEGDDGSSRSAENRESAEIEIQIISGATDGDGHSIPDCCDLVCPFSSNREHSVLESENRSKSMAKLFGLMIFCVIVMVVEIVGGVKSNSLAILADAAHMLTDVAGLGISLFAAWASGWEPTSRHSFGFHRLEVLGALISVQLIWMISGFLIYEAVHRIIHKADRVNGKLMFMIAAFGFLINLVMIMWLGHDHHGHHHHGHGHHHHNHHHGHHHEHSSDEELCALAEGGHGNDEDEDEEKSIPIATSDSKSRILNINLQGAYLHIVADLIQSIGVMVAGAIIWAWPRLVVVDLISTLMFSVLVLSTTVPLLRNIVSVLMERAPSEIDIASLEDGIKGIKGVHSVHDLHVWSITVGKSVMSCHVVPEPGVRFRELLNRIRDYCQINYRIHHVTIQFE